MAGPTSANYDATPDGERFLMIEDALPAAECERLRVVSNWSLGLKNPAAIHLQSSRWLLNALFGLSLTVEDPKSPCVQFGLVGRGCIAVFGHDDD